MVISILKLCTVNLKVKFKLRRKEESIEEVIYRNNCIFPVIESFIKKGRI